MSEATPTPNSNQSESSEDTTEDLSTSPSTFSATTTARASSEQSTTFIDTYECAKNNYNWYRVSATIAKHPEWLTRIPQGRRWTILHQVVFFGNVDHLNELLRHQVSNNDFNFLCKTLDDKTVREVAVERAHIYPHMLRHIERLVATDQMLHNARDGKWDLVRQFLRQKPDIVNEKPPYRREYLIHLLAATGQLDKFKELCEICQFKLDLLANNKTVSQIALENNNNEFAEHIENLISNGNNTVGVSHADTSMENHSDPAQIVTTATSGQEFDDDPGIMVFSFNPNLFGNATLSSNALSSSSSSSFPHPHYPQAIYNHLTNHLNHIAYNSSQGPLVTTMSTAAMVYDEDSSDEEDAKKKKSETKPAPVEPTMTEEDIAKYEQTIMRNIKKLNSDSLLNAITCCITKNILRDPVVAADGFTYEREAILSWFDASNRSPMTNQELENKDLKTNFTVKAILQSLSDTQVSNISTTPNTNHDNDDAREEQQP